VPLPVSAVVTKRLAWRGFIVADFAAQYAAARERLGGWLAAGELRAVATGVKGLARAGEAFASLFDGGTHHGKLFVEV
jgi:NADPH-dependent curcumin reductase CurA